jgi:S1-C subfamily serine protease
MKHDDYHKKVIKIISQKLIVDIQQPFKLIKSSANVCTGFFITNEYVLTCAHCVINSNDILFEIPYIGEKKHKLELLGVCPNFDIALLKSTEYKSKSFFKLGDAYKIKAGQEVFAVGFPLGQSNLKITRGIISGIQFDSIQIDAPINPGNSGGPLVFNGKIIGINKSGYNKSNNIGYAAPIFNFTTIKKELMDKKNILIKRPEIGFETNNVSKDMILIKKSSKDGVYINTIFENSPISKSKICKGDILTQINNSTIDNYGLIKSKITASDKVSYTSLFELFEQDKKVNIEYSHNGKISKTVFNYSFFELPIKYIYPRFDKIEYEILGGVIFMDFYLNHVSLVKEKQLPPTFLMYLNDINRTKSKIIISYIYPNTDVSNIDVLEVGDFIKYVNNIEVSNMQEFRKVITKCVTVNNIKYISLKTEENKEIVLNIKDILIKEPSMSETFKYPITDVYKKLKKLI